ncbi:glutamine amidotransferase subunit PdxT [Rickettsiella grylli]|uniref:pyridoxal 5'-phosphate synthase glutaminase subunit PdxT n=1 Tax=Rickettsiella grylli TaxID=59196 RepID=UPI0008FD5381|nr:pyridoxal 5'-phosphate synthase glutaminase subunit PdxT [Rickettsiella grylli]OJA00069.1 glutamine amidotransferase subunit PdxT [Rickettsiella grylli]
MNIGVLALQGGYQAHINVLNTLGVYCSLIRERQTLQASDALIIPGGESSALIQLLKTQQLWTPLKEYNKPIFGTCAGAILLAKSVLSPAQESLSRINIRAIRNAYGRQRASHVVQGHCIVNNTTLEMVFIRAPKFQLLSPVTLKILATYQEEVVAVQENNVIAASFHPELSHDHYLHRYFIQQVGCSAATAF